MAKCFDLVGYIEPCNAVRQKYTGRALLIKGDGLTLELSTNGLVLNKILNNTSFQDFYNAVQDIPTIKILPVSVSVQDPFGVTVQGNTDSGRVMYTKTIPVSIPAMYDGKAEEFIVGLQSGIRGFQAILVIEKVIDGTGNVSTDVFGTYSPIRLDPTSVTRSEYENGGAWTFNLVCEEPVPNVLCDMTGLSAVFDAMQA